MSQGFICKAHGTRYGRHATDWCDGCMQEFDERREADSMTGPQRRDAMNYWHGPLTIPFTNVHRRIEELVGRPVFTHELGLCWSALVDEAGSDDRGIPLTVEQVQEPLVDAGIPHGTVRVETDRSRKGK